MKDSFYDLDEIIINKLEIHNSQKLIKKELGLNAYVTENDIKKANLKKLIEDDTSECYIDFDYYDKLCKLFNKNKKYVLYDKKSEFGEFCSQANLESSNIYLLKDYIFNSIPNNKIYRWYTANGLPFLLIDKLYYKSEMEYSTRNKTYIPKNIKEGWLLIGISRLNKETCFIAIDPKIMKIEKDYENRNIILLCSRAGRRQITSLITIYNRILYEEGSFEKSKKILEI